MTTRSVRFVGNIGRVDSKVVTTRFGDRTVTNISVAHNEDDTTTWHRVTLWGKAAEVAAETFEVGQRVGVAGEFTERAWSNERGSGVNIESQTATIVPIVTEDVSFEPVSFRDFMSA
jgi:single-stranded DNA-binding protein